MARQSAATAAAATATAGQAPIRSLGAAHASGVRVGHTAQAVQEIAGGRHRRRRSVAGRATAGHVWVCVCLDRGASEGRRAHRCEIGGEVPRWLASLFACWLVGQQLATSSMHSCTSGCGAADAVHAGQRTPCMRGSGRHAWHTHACCCKCACMHVCMCYGVPWRARSAAHATMHSFLAGEVSKGSTATAGG
eukprot:359178-Chlamydomonas_euryale.AAC.4